MGARAWMSACDRAAVARAPAHGCGFNEPADTPASLVGVAAAFGRPAAPAGRLGNDPADSWLAYAKADGKGSRVLSVNMTWTVPAYPKTRPGGNAPGWWFGIEPNPANVLIQPILAYGDGTPEYTIVSAGCSMLAVSVRWRAPAVRCAPRARTCPTVRCPPFCTSTPSIL